MTARTRQPDPGFRVGARVRVRSAQEIAATLDARAAVGDTVFMPEMVAFAGRTFDVDAVVHRTCDGNGSTNRDLTGTVHLQGVRCDGSAHGGCQARCLLFWRQEWLEPVAGPAAEASDGPVGELAGHVAESVAAAARGEGDTVDEPVYSCQATRVRNAVRLASMRDPRLLVKDVRAGNATVRQALVSYAVPAFNAWQLASRRLPAALRLRRGETYPWPPAPTGERRRPAALSLEPGELVEIRSREEIEATLNENSELRGLSFAVDMVPFCGKRARVLGRVERIVDEETGRMLRLRDCIVLDDVWCHGTFRLLCRRKIYSYWREAWLRRVEEDPAVSPAVASESNCSHTLGI
jgi:hypothetical protein